MKDIVLKIDPPEGVCHLCFKIENPVILNANNIPERKFIQLRKFQKYEWTPVNICRSCYVIVKTYSSLIKSASHKIRKYRKLKKQETELKCLLLTQVQSLSERRYDKTAILKKKKHGNVSAATADGWDEVSGEANHSERTNVCDTTESVPEHVTPNKDNKMKQKKKVTAVRENSALSTSEILPQSVVNGWSTNGMSESCTSQKVNSSLEMSNVDRYDKLSSSRKLKRSANSNSEIIPHSFKLNKLANYPPSKITKISDCVLNTNKKHVLQNCSNRLNATEMRVSHIDNTSNMEYCGVHSTVTVEDTEVEIVDEDTSSVKKNNIVLKQSESVNSNVNKELLPKSKKKPVPKCKPGSNNMNLSKILANMPSKSKPAYETALDCLTKNDIEMRKKSVQTKSGDTHTPNSKKRNDIDTNNQKINRNSISKQNNVKKSCNNTAKHNRTYSRNTNNGIQSTEISLREGCYRIRRVKGSIKVDKATQVNSAIEKPIGCTRNKNHVQKATEMKDSTITAPNLPNSRVVSKSPSKTALSSSNNIVASTSQPNTLKWRIKVKDANLLFNNKPTKVTENLSNGLDVNTVSNNSKNNQLSNKLTNNACAGRNSQIVGETENLIPLHDVKIGPGRNEGRQSQEFVRHAVQEQMDQIPCNIKEELPVDGIKREVESSITREMSGLETSSNEEILPDGMQVRDISGIVFLIGHRVDINCNLINNNPTNGEYHLAPSNRNYNRYPEGVRNFEMSSTSCVSEGSPSAIQQPPENLPEMVSESRYVNEFVYPEVTNSPVVLFCRICKFIIKSGLDYRMHKKVCKNCRIGYWQ